MKKIAFFLLILASFNAHSQTTSGTLNAAWPKFTNDPAFKHASLSLFIVNNKTGKPVLEANSQTGLAPASSLKVVTSAAAYALLGRDYKYKTGLSYTGKIENGILEGDIIITGSGDPSLGSWRYESTKEERIINEFLAAISKQGIDKIKVGS